MQFDQEDKKYAIEFHATACKRMWIYFYPIPWIPSIKMAAQPDYKHDDEHENQDNMSISRVSLTPSALTLRQRLGRLKSSTLSLCYYINSV